MQLYRNIVLPPKHVSSFFSVFLDSLQLWMTPDMVNSLWNLDIGVHRDDNLYKGSSVNWVFDGSHFNSQMPPFLLHRLWIVDKLNILRTVITRFLLWRLGLLRSSISQKCWIVLWLQFFCSYALKVIYLRLLLKLLGLGAATDIAVSLRLSVRILAPKDCMEKL